MRCYCCNRLLNDWESTLRHAETNEFLDTCNHCLSDLGVPYAGREDLAPYDLAEEEDPLHEEYE